MKQPVLIRLSLADHPTLVEKNGLTKDFVWPCFDEEHRVSVTDVPISERLKGIDTEDRQGINMEEAQREASRCFNCGCVAVNPSDIGVALLALNGKIVTTKRNIDAKDFFAPHATASTILDADEVIKEIRLPRVPDGTRQNYLKFTLRKPVDFAIVSVGCVVSPQERNLHRCLYCPWSRWAGASSGKDSGKDVNRQVDY